MVIVVRGAPVVMDVLVPKASDVRARSVKNHAIIAG
jgi:hypothetical protein